MNLQTMFGNKVSLQRRLLFTILGAVFAFLDLFTEHLGFAVDLAWITVLLCGVPILLQAVSAVADRFEIHGNFLTAVAMVALVSVGEYHPAAYIALIAQTGMILEQWIIGDRQMDFDDDWIPTMPDPLVVLRDGISRWSSVIVVAVIFIAMGSYAITRDFMHTVTLLLVLCPCTLELIISTIMMTGLVESSPMNEFIPKSGRQVLLFTLLASMILHGSVIVLGVLGLVGPVEAVLLHGVARLVSVINLQMIQRYFDKRVCFD